MSDAPALSQRQSQSQCRSRNESQNQNQNESQDPSWNESQSQSQTNEYRYCVVPRLVQAREVLRLRISQSQNQNQGQGQGQSQSQDQNQTQSRSQSQPTEYLYSVLPRLVQAREVLRLRISESQAQKQNQSQTACALINDQDLQAQRLHIEILRLLVSRKPNTLHIRQRHRDAIYPGSHAARVRSRYAECRVVLGAVVLDLGGVCEEEEGGCQRKKVKRGERVMVGKKRSCVERRRWLEGVERRVERTGRYVAGVGEEEEEERGSVSMPVQRMSGRQEPFEERSAAARQRVREEGSEYAAVAGEALLHPGVMVSVKGKLGQLTVQTRGISQGQGQRGKTEVHRHAPLQRSVQSSSNVPATRSMNTITTAGTHSVFKSMRYMIFGTRHFKRAIVLRGSGQKAKQKQRSHSADARLPSISASGKARRTTSGLPSEISAGSFGARSEVEERRLARRGSKDVSRAQMKTAVDISQPRRRGANGAAGTTRREHVGCAPGPSTRKTHDNVEKNFCENCEPARSAAESKDITALRLSLEGSKDKTPAVSLPGPLVLVPWTNPGLPPQKCSAFSSTNSAVPRLSLPQTPWYGVVEPHTPQLKRTLRVDKKANAESPIKLDEVLVDERAIWTRCSERLDHVSAVAATEAWARILRHREEDATRKAVCGHQERSKAVGQLEEVNALAKGDTTTAASSVSSVQIFATETAAKIHMKRVRMGDVDCRSVAGRREMLPQKQNPPRYKPTSAIQDLNESIRDLSAAATRAAACSNVAPRDASPPPPPPPAQTPLKTPWEAAWHRAHPVRLRPRCPPTPDTYARAPSVAYSLSNAVSEAEDLEALHGGSTDALMRLREGSVAMRGKVVENGEVQRESLVAVVEEVRFDSAMGMSDE